MESFRVQFLNMRDGKKEYREYPKLSQFKNRKLLCEFLQNRKFLTSEAGWIVDIIKEFDPIKEKLELANQIGRLIYFT
jgi:hypothetical protein